MLENDKHVLCEKPMTLSVNHTVELVELAKEKKKFFQEVRMSFFFSYQVAHQLVRVKGMLRWFEEVNCDFSVFGIHFLF